MVPVPPLRLIHGTTKPPDPPRLHIPWPIPPLFIHRPPILPPWPHPLLMNPGVHPLLKFPWFHHPLFQLLCIPPHGMLFLQLAPPFLQILSLHPGLILWPHPPLTQPNPLFVDSQPLSIDPLSSSLPHLPRPWPESPPKILAPPPPPPPPWIISPPVLSFIIPDDPPPIHALRFEPIIPLCPMPIPVDAPPHILAPPIPPDIPAPCPSSSPPLTPPPLWPTAQPVNRIKIV